MWHYSTPRVGQLAPPPQPQPGVFYAVPDGSPGVYLANPAAAPSSPSQGAPWLLAGGLILGGALLLAKGLRVF